MTTTIHEDSCTCDECYQEFKNKEALFGARATRFARAQMAEEDFVPYEIVYELDLTDPDYLIAGWLEAGAVGLFTGPPGSAKTTMALDWALSVAAGRAWQGHAVAEAGTILYIVAEGSQGMSYRRAAWVHEHVPVGRGAGFITRPVKLHNAAAVQSLCDDIRERKISLVVIDTLARSIPGLNENDAGDMGLVIENLYRLRDAWYDNGTAVLVVCHTGKNQGLGARGSSRLESDVDFVYQFSKGEGTRPFVMKCRKMKDDAEPEPFAYRLRRVPVKKRSATVIEAAGKPLTPSAQKVLDFLRDRAGTAEQIMTETGLSEGSVRTALKDFDGQVTHAGRPAVYTAAF